MVCWYSHFSPILISIPVGSFLAARFFENQKIIALAIMCVAVLIWSVVYQPFYFYFMKKIFYFLSLCCLFLHKMDDRGYIVKLGQQAPEFEFTLLSGDTINNDVLKGRL